jgi:lysophospholipase L1-like esterase
MRTLTGLLAAVVLLGTASFASAQEFFFNKGDVVVVMGDSITEQRLYSNYIEIWSQTRFPSYNLVFRNVGIGGDTSGGGNNRFKRDVLAFKPTVLTVDFGMNDGRYQWPGRIVKTLDVKKKAGEREVTEADIKTNYDLYMKGLQGIADQAKAAKIRVAWITPQPVEHNPGTEDEKYNKTLEKFSAGVKDIAKKNDGLFVDQFHPYWEVIEEARKNGEKGRITGGDAVHPQAPGQALMAYAILKGMNFPRQVSSVEINGKKEFTKNCKVTELTSDATHVKFMREDTALPYFPEAAKSILKYASLLEDMNYYGLQVKGLKEGKYDVLLGGKKAGTFTDQELAKSVNLAAGALASGPVADQVKDVVKAVNDKTSYYHDQIYVPIVRAGKATNNPDYDERMKKMADYDAAIRKALEPRAHLVEVVPAK